MKKVLLPLLLILSFTSFSQTFPNNPTSSSIQTKSVNLGAGQFNRGMIAGNFVSLAQADGVPYMKNTPGIIISVGTSLYIRNTTATQWVNISGNANCAGLLNGGIVSWSGTGLTFNVTPALYCIGGASYSTAGASFGIISITLNAAHPTLPRLDIIAVDTFGVVVKITGTPATNPAIPQINVASQVYLTSILVPAASTVPGGITSTTVYDENTEWTTSSVGAATIGFANTVTPYRLTKCVNITGLSPGSQSGMNFTNSTVVSISSYSVLNLFLNNVTTDGKVTFSAMLLKGGNRVTLPIYINSTYGYDAFSTGGYQNISIPTEDFMFFGLDRTFDAIQFYIDASSAVTQKLDYVTLQGGITNISSPYLTDVYRKVASDSVFKVINGVSAFAFIDSITPKDTLYILATGQSNSGGFALNAAGGTDTYSVQDTAMDVRVQGWDTTLNVWKTYIVGRRPGYTFGLDFPGFGYNISPSSQFYLARKYARERNCIIRMLMVTEGGKTISFWHDGTTEGSYMKIIKRLTANANVKKYDLIIWDQGESNSASTPAYYNKAWDSVKANFRTFTPMTTPIVAVGMPRSYQGGLPGYLDIDPTLQNFDRNNDPWDGYATTDSAKLNPDGLHFNKFGLKYIGEESVWQAWKALPTPYGSAGVTSLSAIGSTPNANGATITGSVLNLQPASASFGGVLTAISQSIKGDKNFLDNLSMGNATSTSTATPLNFDMGGTFSNTAGANLKLKLYNDSSLILGLGVSSFQMDYAVPSAFSHSFYVAGTKNFNVNGAGAQVTGNLSVSNLATGLTAPTTTGTTKLVTVDANGLFSNTAITAYENPLTFNSGLSRSVNTVTLNQAFAPTWTAQHIFSDSIKVLGKITGGSASGPDMPFELITPPMMGANGGFKIEKSDWVRPGATRMRLNTARVDGYDSTWVFSGNGVSGGLIVNPAGSASPKGFYLGSGTGVNAGLNGSRLLFDVSPNTTNEWSVDAAYPSGVNFVRLQTQLNGAMVSTNTGVTGIRMPIKIDARTVDFYASDTAANLTTTPKLSITASGAQAPLLIGGTAVGSNITYRSTTGAGTATGIAHQFTGGTNGATVIQTMLNNGTVGIGTSTPATTTSLEVNSASSTKLVDFIGSSGQSRLFVNTNGGGGFSTRSSQFSIGIIDAGLNAATRFLTLPSGFSYIDGYSEGSGKASNYDLIIGSRVNNTNASITGNTTAETGTNVQIGFESATKPSAILSLNTVTRGFLPPRMTATQASAISSPAEGLMVYVTNTNATFLTKGWWGWNGAAWEKLNN